jgi:hypothetical protein
MSSEKRALPNLKVKFHQASRQANKAKSTQRINKFFISCVVSDGRSLSVGQTGSVCKEFRVTKSQRSPHIHIIISNSSKNVKPIFPLDFSAK